MAEEQTKQSEETSEETNGGSAGETLTRELKQAIREAAMEVLGPAARQATTSAAKYAVSKGPELMSRNVMPAMEKRGGPGGMAQEAISKGGEALSGAGGIKGLAGKVMSKLGGGGDASGWGRNRRMPVQQLIWVSVPVNHVYNGWTEYKNWPRYMHRANQVDPQIDDKAVRIKVTEKMWGFTRPFTAEVIEQRPDERIKWQSTEGTKHTGVINFHEMGPRLTLVEVNLDHAPSGLVEKIARGSRFVKRAVRADFHRFQAWIEMKTDEELDELEGWRGTIGDGQIVTTHEDAVEEQRSEQDGDQRDDEDEAPKERAHDDSEGTDEEPEGEYDEESDGEDRKDEEPEGEFAEEPEDEAKPEDEPDDGDAEEEEEPDSSRRRRQPQRQSQRRRPARRGDRARR